jgi:hypothetical protein
MSARLPIILALSAILWSCTTAHQRFGDASLAFAQGVASRTAGDVLASARLHQRGISLTQELLVNHPESPLAQAVLADVLSVGPYRWSIIKGELAARIALWGRYDTHLLVRAYLEALRVPRQDGQLDLMVQVAEALVAQGDSDAARVVLGSARELVFVEQDRATQAWERLALARATRALGDEEEALDEFHLVLDLLHEATLDTGLPDADLLGEVLEFIEPVEDKETALSLLERADDIAQAAELTPGPDLFLEEIAFAMARRGDCLSAQSTIESLLSFSTEDACGCPDIHAQPDLRARLELVFDIFDECVEGDPQSARVLLEDARIEATELGWDDFLADIAWGFATLNDEATALAIARAIHSPTARVDALLAVASERDTDGSETELEALDILLEAVDTPLTGVDPKVRLRYRATFAQRLAAAGDNTRAAEQARLTFSLVKLLSVGDRLDVLSLVHGLANLLSDTDRDALLTLTLAEATANPDISARLQILLTAFDAYLTVADKVRGNVILDRAVTLAAAESELEDDAFWCTAATGFAALGDYPRCSALLDRLSSDPLVWCLKGMAYLLERQAPDAGLAQRIRTALKGPAPEALDAADETEAVPDCKAALAALERQSSPGADRATALLELAQRCPAVME